MTLPTSGPLKISDIAGEFGGSAPYHLSDYYAGGPHVPSGTIGTNGAVPTSGALAFSKFYGTSNFGPFVFACSDHGHTNSNGGGPPAIHHVIEDADGNAPFYVSGGPTPGPYSYAWTVDSIDSGITMSNLTSAQPHAHFDYLVSPQTSVTKVVVMHCLVTDLTSGYSYTINNVQMSDEFTNNTG